MENINDVSSKKWMVKQVEFPITVTLDDGSVQAFADIHEATCSLEWFDTETEDVKVVDNKHRRVHLKITALQLEICELYSDVSPQN